MLTFTLLCRNFILLQWIIDTMQPELIIIIIPAFYNNGPESKISCYSIFGSMFPPNAFGVIPTGCHKAQGWSGNESADSLEEQ